MMKSVTEIAGDEWVTIALIAIHHLSGLNGRSSAKLAFEALQFESDIVLTPNGRSVNGQDLMSVMALRAKVGTHVRVLAIGPDEIQAVRRPTSTLVPAP